MKQKIQCILWNNNIKSITQDITKKNKLENQGYILKQNTMTNGNILIYIKRGNNEVKNKQHTIS